MSWEPLDPAGIVAEDRGVLEAIATTACQAEGTCLWVDDAREAPPGWADARTAAQAVTIIDAVRDRLYAISLDHDLAETATGYDLLWHLFGHDVEPMHVTLHSSNPIGMEAMRMVLRERLEYVERNPNWFTRPVYA